MLRQKELFILYICVIGLIPACGGRSAGGGETNQLEDPTSIPSFQCEDTLGCVDIPAGDPIHIAWMQATSGAFGLLGQSNIRGAEVALNEIGFELLGHPIQWDGVDSRCSHEGGQAAGELLAEDPSIVAIIGPTCAPEAQGGLSALSDAGFAIISPSITHPDFTDPNSSVYTPGLIRVAHNDALQGRIAAEYAFKDLGLTTAATIVDGSVYSLALQKSFSETFSSLGGTIVSQSTADPGATDLTDLLTQLAGVSPQILYFPVFQPLGASIASQKCGIPGLSGVQMMSADGLLSSTFPSTVGDCSVGLLLTGAYIDPSQQSSFLNAYLQEFGEGPTSPFAPQAYDAVRLLAAAVEAVSTQDINGVLHVPRQALRDTLFATANFAGISGALSCSPNGDCATGQSMAVFQINQENVSGALDLLTNAPIWTPKR